MKTIVTFKPSISNEEKLKKIPNGQKSKIINAALARYFGSLPKEDDADVVIQHLKSALHHYLQASIVAETSGIKLPADK
jgi:hypothetical protein